MSDEVGLFEAMYSCRAMRRIEPRPVERAVIERLIEAAHRGPSASNAQHDRWVVLTDPAQRKAMADLNRAAVDRSYASFRGTAKESAFQWQYENLEQVPVHIVGCLHLLARRDDFHGGVAAGGSIWPKVQNLLLAARGLGLGACPTTLPLQDREKAKEVLGLPDDVEPFCLIPVGYPKGRFGPVTRRPVGEIIHWNTW